MHSQKQNCENGSFPRKSFKSHFPSFFHDRRVQMREQPLKQNLFTDSTRVNRHKREKCVDSAFGLQYFLMNCLARCSMLLTDINRPRKNCLVDLSPIYQKILSQCNFLQDLHLYFLSFALKMSYNTSQQCTQHPVLLSRSSTIFQFYWEEKTCLFLAQSMSIYSFQDVILTSGCSQAGNGK